MAGNKPYIEHKIAKQITDLAVGFLDYDTTVPQLFLREGYEKWVGKAGDKLTYRTPGRLPYRKRPFRDDRTKPLQFDVYAEATGEITWGGKIYSGAEVTDEQQDFDLNNWEPILSAQAQAVAQGVNDNISSAIEDAPFEVIIGGTEADLYGAFVEARRVLTAFRVPGPRFAILGSDFEAAILNDKRITLAQNSGDGVAEGALRDAHIGRIAGFDIFVDPSAAPDAAFVGVGSAFVQTVGAPSVPRSVYAGATMSLPSGTAARWIMDYDLDYQKDRSVIDCYVGSAPIMDRYLPKSVLEENEDAPKVYDPEELNEYFVRGVKMTLGGTSTYPNPSTKADLVAETGISNKKVWKPNVTAPEPEPAG